MQPDTFPEPGDATCACGRPVRHGVAPPVELALDVAGGVTARLEGVGVEVCPDGHARAVDDRLAERVHRALAGQVLLAQSRLLRREDACGDCGAALTMPGRRTQTPVVDDGGPTVVTLVPDATMVRCPDCGREQFSPAVAAALDDLVDALVAAVTTD